MVGWLFETLLDALATLWGLLIGTVFVRPDVTRLPQVVRLAGSALDVVIVCSVLAVLWAAIMVMARGTLQSALGPAELIPRLILGLIGANFGLPICAAAIELGNALTAALTGQDVTVPGTARY